MKALTTGRTTGRQTPPQEARALAVLVGVARGVWAVVVLLATAADELVTAVLGTAPVLPRLARGVRGLARQVAREAGDAFRGGRADVVDAEVIEDERRWR